MSTDYSEMEREFLSGLEADTGRDLAAWMAAITAQNLPHRNDVIDWLRQQGFMFARASWLERIYHNGGRPIYLSTAEARALTEVPPAKRAPDPRAGAPQPLRYASPPQAPVMGGTPPHLTTGTSRPPAAMPSAVQRAMAMRPSAPASVPASSTDVDAVLARGKAYRPLAEHLLRHIRSIVSPLQIDVAAGCICIGNPGIFAVMTVSAREVRLGVALADGLAMPHFEPGRPPGAPASISHVAVLTDARQVTDDLLARVREANRRVNGDEA